MKYLKHLLSFVSSVKYKKIASSNSSNWAENTLSHECLSVNPVQIKIIYGLALPKINYSEDAMFFTIPPKTPRLE